METSAPHAGRVRGVLLGAYSSSVSGKSSFTAASADLLIIHLILFLCFFDCDDDRAFARSRGAAQIDADPINAQNTGCVSGHRHERTSCCGDLAVDQQLFERFRAACRAHDVMRLTRTDRDPGSLLYGIIFDCKSGEGFCFFLKIFFDPAFDAQPERRDQHCLARRKCHG